MAEGKKQFSISEKSSSVLSYPVWSDGRHEIADRSTSYYLGDQPLPLRLVGVPEQPGNSIYSQNNSSLYKMSPRRKASIAALPETPDSTEEAFRLINQGVTAESEGRYAAAMRNFLDAGEMLTRVGEREEDPHVRNLLHQKAIDVLGWTEALANWIDSGRAGPVPPRTGRTVSVFLPGRVHSANVAPISEADPHEFNTMYYTAVSTKKASNFTRDGYVLRVMQNARRPKLLVVITMYNEDEQELHFTLRKVANNIKYIQKMELPGYDHDLAWQNVLVCIVSDGRTKANPQTLHWLREVGVFDEEAMTINSVGTDVQMHLFEYSLRMMRHSISRGAAGKTKVVEGNEVHLPLQVVFALKEYNGGKLNSHEWYFNSFAEQVMPKYTVLLDVGTMPTKSAFYRLLAAMETNAHIGGVCGEIAVDRPIPNLCNWVIAAQHYEYKLSNILDKSMESVFGFISVLPGAFSAYRYEAIRGAPLQAYFKALTTPMKELGPFQGNMYLAEDRILCFEIVAKRNCKWTLHYVKNAIARTDVPTNLVGLIGQRRRWLNGSFFAILYTVAYWGRIYTQSNHSFVRKFVFLTQYFFNVITVVFNWFLVSNFYLSIYFVVVRGLIDNNYGFVDTRGVPVWARDLISNVFQYSYGLFFLVQIVTGLGNKPKNLPVLYTLSAIYFGIIVVIALTIASLIFFFGSTFNAFTVTFAILILGVYFISAALHCELHHILMSFGQYMTLLPTTINVLMAYSFCNLHDLSWGTKGLEDSGGGHGPEKKEAGNGMYQDMVAAKKAAEERAKKAAQEKEQLEKTFNLFRSKLLCFWLLCNISFTFGVQLYLSATYYLTTLYICIGFINLWRFVGSTAYLLTYAGDKLYAGLCLRRKMRKEAVREASVRRKAEATYGLSVTPKDNASTMPV